MMLWKKKKKVIRKESDGHDCFWFSFKDTTLFFEDLSSKNKYDSKIWQKVLKRHRRYKITYTKITKNTNFVGRKLLENVDWGIQIIAILYPFGKNPVFLAHKKKRKPRSRIKKMKIIIKMGCIRNTMNKSALQYIKNLAYVFKINVA